MNARYKQTGVSLFSVLLLVAMFSFFLTVMLRLVPTYMNGRNVKTAIESVAANSDASQSLREVNKRLNNSFTTNQIVGITPRDVKVYRDEGAIVIDARHEVRTHLFEGIDAVLMFDDLVVRVE